MTRRFITLAKGIDLGSVSTTIREQDETERVMNGAGNGRGYEVFELVPVTLTEKKVLVETTRKIIL